MPKEEGEAPRVPSQRAPREEERVARQVVTAPNTTNTATVSATNTLTTDAVLVDTSEGSRNLREREDALGQKK